MTIDPLEQFPAVALAMTDRQMAFDFQPPRKEQWTIRNSTG
jgi:hypothetical protein